MTNYKTNIFNELDAPLDLPEHSRLNDIGYNKMYIDCVSDNIFINELLAAIKVFEYEILHSQSINVKDTVSRYDLIRWKSYFKFLSDKMRHKLLEKEKVK